MDNQVYAVQAESYVSGEVPFGTCTIIQRSWVHHQTDTLTRYTKEDKWEEEGAGSAVPG